MYDVLFYIIAYNGHDWSILLRELKIYVYANSKSDWVM